MTILRSRKTLDHFALDDYLKVIVVNPVLRGVTVHKPREICLHGDS